jgi:DnaJ-class molecular chaperone
MSRRDHYEVLGVSRSAGAGDIRRAYRALALRYHPDVYAGADAGRRFREVADAYDVLHDPAQRARYDAMSRPARDLEARAVSWPIARRPPDAPRFVDEEHEIGGDDLISEFLRSMLQPGWATPPWASSGEWWPSTRSMTTEVWQWR